MIHQTKQKDSERRVYSVREFCNAYRVSRSFAYKLMQIGKLRTISVGGRRLIPVEAAEELINGGQS
jgi:excisionase family DNA binding protein